MSVNKLVVVVVVVCFYLVQTKCSIFFHSHMKTTISIGLFIAAFASNKFKLAEEKA